MDKSAQILLHGIGKKYKHWVFRDVSLDLAASHHHGIIGRNGSGKSTLLKIIAGYTSPTTGQVSLFFDDTKIESVKAAKMVSFAAPYIDLIEELTVSELFQFHRKFQKIHPEAEKLEIFLETVQLTSHQDVMVGDLSSGLMQRLKVGLAVLSQTPVLLLDEPTSYLDAHGKDWFHLLLQQYVNNRLVIIASNDQFDLETCLHIVDIQQFASQVH